MYHSTSRRVHIYLLNTQELLNLFTPALWKSEKWGGSLSGHDFLSHMLKSKQSLLDFLVNPLWNPNPCYFFWTGNVNIGQCHWIVSLTNLRKPCLTVSVVVCNNVWQQKNISDYKYSHINVHLLDSTDVTNVNMTKWIIS